MTARVVVRSMPGWSTYCQPVRYWRWRCEACGCFGHWSGVDFAHDDGRYHARYCGALKYGRLQERIQDRVEYYGAAADRACNGHWRQVWALTRDALTDLLPDA